MLLHPLRPLYKARPEHLKSVDKKRSPFTTLNNVILQLWELFQLLSPKEKIPKITMLDF